MNFRNSSLGNFSLRNFRLGNSSFSNSRIPYYVIPQLELRISIWNSRILCDEILGSSRGMTEGLGILDFRGAGVFALGILEFLESSLGILEFILGILEFPTMSSPSLFGG